MNILVTHVLTKMEEEIAKAKHTSSPQALREHMYAVRALCDVILQQPPTIVATQPTTKERLDIDGDANGPSLLDF
ncbi:YwdI family protein [Anoxybacillus kestanbolensis]|uniref:YwdI family protein n=1 Tax=Anoxybacillus kestanbolensis TaxID=227476 RepID=UPI003D204F86